VKKENKIRIAKFLADAGVASRRKAEELIIQGKISIDNEIITNLATKVDEDTDNIRVNNKLIKPDKKIYYLLNKPLDYICSVKDPHNYQTVLQLVPDNPRVVPVGRLDKNSQGLLLLTNDGDLTYRLTHPKFEVKKTYLVKTKQVLDKNIIRLLKQGVNLEEGKANADQVKLVSRNKLEIVIHQGWKRQIRRMMQELGYHVEELTRIQEGKLKLGDLPVGKYKKISKKDI
jgi:23S rRNA pseudouridine2605 synthase